MTLIIDDNFCERYLKDLPEQQISVDDEGKIIPVNQHWVGKMIDDVFNSPDPSCERFSRLIKANFRLFQEYAKKVGSGAGMTRETQATLMLELVAIFAYNVLKKAHEEAIERMKNGLE